MRDLVVLVIYLNGMNKSLRSPVERLESTLKKSPLKDPSEEEAILRSQSRSPSDRSNERSMRNLPVQLVEFEEFTLETKPPTSKDTRRKMHTQFNDKQTIGTLDPPKTSARIIREAFPDQGGVTPQESYRERGGEESLVKELDKYKRELDNYKRELMIKDGQIAMLERLINQYLGKGLKEKGTGYHWEEVEMILREKDANLQEISDKMMALNQSLKQKSEELAQVKYENNKLRNSLENIENEMYLASNKEYSHRLTRRFYVQKDGVNDHQTKPSSFWEEEVRPSLRPEGFVRGIDDLQKRLDLLKENRLQLQRSKSRNKNKSMRESKQENTWVCQTTKNKTKNKSNADFHIPSDRYENSFIDRRKKENHTQY